MISGHWSSKLIEKGSKMFLKISLCFILFAPVSGVFAQGARKDLNRGGGKAVYSTNLDFDSTMIDGKMKAPMGFFLQGRNKQSLTNMVKLRSGFKNEMRRSRTAIKARVR